MKYLAPLLTLLLINTIGCAVAPGLESPRIKTGIKLQLDATGMRNEMKWHLSDSVMRGGIYSNELKYNFGESPVEYAPKIQFAFLNRVELGGYFWWFFTSCGWDGKIKITIGEAGKNVIFRNIAIALLAGSKGSFGEWDRSDRTWGGMTLGTLHKINNFEFEYILMFSVGTNHLTSLDDGLGSGGVTFSDVLIHTGPIISFSKRLYASCAMIASPYEFRIHRNNNSSFGLNSRIDGIKFIPQKIGFDLTLGWRFGG